MAIFICVVALAAIAAGCGSSDDDGTTVILTKTEYVKKADAICTKASQKRTKALQDYLEGSKIDLEKALPKAKEEEIINDVALPPFQVETEQLAALGAPEGKEDQAEELVEALEGAIASIEANSDGFLDGSGGQFDEAAAVGEELGLKVCGQF